ncbi:MAG: hypothetical protein EHM61_09885 [Acidobacteria bacterium]|nr:MAG: hypothetical protein EHM61_09885 [Acidobacteriota bacterium]
MDKQRGVALLIALIIAILLSLFALSLTFSSLKDFASSTEFERHEKALLIADAGFNAVKQSLRGRDLSTLLAASAEVPIYVSGGSADWPTVVRMPILPIDARNVDFESTLPGAIGSRSVTGLLTPPTGERFGEEDDDDYSGHYFAKITDNRDEAAFGVPDDPRVDRDGFVYLRVVGVYRGLPGEVMTHETSVKNSVAVIEAQLKRDMSFELQSPLSVYGSNVNSTFNGNSFQIDGYDHRGMDYNRITGGHNDHDLPAFPGISALYGQGNAQTSVDAMKAAMKANDQQDDNITGQGGEPSILDGTQAIRDSPSEDAENIFDGNFLVNFATMMAAVADFKYPDQTDLSGNKISLGTAADPKITYAEGNFSISGSGDGAGVMIVRGALNIGGSFTYDGVILVLGQGSLRMHGSNKSLIGGVYVVNVTRNGDGSASFGTPTIDIQGNSNFYMKSDSITMAVSLLPMRILSWVEVTPEIEPQQASN